MNFSYDCHSFLLLSRAGIGDGNKELGVEGGSVTVEPPKYDFFSFSFLFPY